MRILITGSSGLIGSTVARNLIGNGHEVICLVRDKSTGDGPWWNLEEEVINLGTVKNIDAVIHLAGENIADKRWSPVKKAAILNSRVKGTGLLANFFATADHKPEVIISGSAVGFYGDCGKSIVDEDSGQGKGFLADVCKQWEEAAMPAVNAGIRVVNIRIGMVLSSSGGALKKMLLPFKMGIGGIIGNGKQYISWININDLVEIIHYIMMNKSITGPVNIVSPNPVTNYQFTKTLGTVLHRPTIVPMPAFLAQLLFGEMANELLLASTRVTPKKLITSGYKFHHSDLTKTFKYLIE